VGAFNVNNLEQVRAIMEAFGRASHAKGYDPISVTDIAVRYKERGRQLTLT
jgi:fructose/tagatose bisphosphate aldolase